MSEANIFEHNKTLIKQNVIIDSLNNVEAQGTISEKGQLLNDCMILLMFGANKVNAWPKHLKSLIIVEPNIWQLKLFLEQIKLPNLIDLLIVTTLEKDELNRIFYQHFRSEARLSCFEASAYTMSEIDREVRTGYYNQVMQSYVLAGQQAITTFSGSPIHFAHGFRHFCYNASKKHIDYRSLKDAAKDIPAVLISGGPSSKKDIEDIKRFKGIISCVDSVYSGLLQQGIGVDYVGSMDREPKLASYYEQVDNSTRLITIPEVSNYILEKFDPEIIMLPTLRKSYVLGLGWEDAYNGGTATTHLVYTYLRYIGCNPIILIGQDFSIPEEEMGTRLHQYSDLVQKWEHGKSDFDSRLNMSVINSLGKKLRTSVSFMEMNNAFQEIIFNDKGKVYNSSEGLDIIGAPHKDLKDFEFAPFSKPSFSPSYRQVNLIDIAIVRTKLKRFRIAIKDVIRCTSIEKMSEKIEKLVASDPIFNDILFVMLSNKWLEYLNQKAKAIITNFSKKSFIFDSRIFVNKICKAIKILELFLDNEKLEEIPKELDYSEKADC